MIRRVAHCDVCGKPLGLRRAAQGVRRHPGCRHILGPKELAAAMDRTRQVLERVSQHVDDDELDPLLVEAAEQAQGVMRDLLRMRDYVNGSRKRGAGPPADQESSTA